jgi:energy-coupling factor transporter transmembrane protein EcfT
MADKPQHRILNYASNTAPPPLRPLILSIGILLPLVIFVFFIFITRYIQVGNHSAILDWTGLAISVATGSTFFYRRGGGGSGKIVVLALYVIAQIAALVIVGSAIANRIEMP